MTQQQYEIEIKSLLGSKDNADALVEKMKASDSDFKILGSHKQLNHYFIGGNLTTLFNKVNHLLSDELKTKLTDLVKRAKNFSVRTREADGRVILVVKASVDDTTSENGTARLEFEAKLDNLNLEELDNLILNAGFTYQAKWSRERQEFLFHSGKRELSVSIDKNAGYGFLAELEVVVNDSSKAEEVKAFIRETMSKLAIEELPQDRLQRMFDFYNKNWSEYYGQF
jgi:adenylate cyclase class IV